MARKRKPPAERSRRAAVRMAAIQSEALQRRAPHRGAKAAV